MQTEQNLDLTSNAQDIFATIVDNPLFMNNPKAAVRMIYKELQDQLAVPMFGQYLKRYINRLQGYSERGMERPLEEYSAAILNAFNSRGVPASFEPGTTKLKDMAKAWPTKRTVSRKTVLLIGLGLGLRPDEVNELLTKGIYEQQINPKDPFEVICWYCYKNGYDYEDFQNLLEIYEELSPKIQQDSVHALDATMNMRFAMYGIENLQDLQEYLSGLKTKYHLSRYSRTAQKTFEARYAELKALISADEGIPVDKVSDKMVEDLIYLGVGRTEDYNLVKENLSAFKDVFDGKRLSRQRLGQLKSGKTGVSRFDLITMNFIVHALQSRESQGSRKPTESQGLRIKLYSSFVKDTNEMLEECSMQELIIQNPYENFILSCMLTSIPLETYWDVWEMSFYEEDYQT